MKKLKTLVFLLIIPFFLASCDNAEDRKASYMEKAEALYVEANYDKAQLEYKNVLQIDPKDVEANYKLGLILEQMQDFRSAAGHYSRVIELDEKYYQAYLKLGRFYLLARNFDKASEYADKALKLAPNDADAYAFRGMVSMQRGAVLDAAKDADAALKIDSSHIDAIAIKSSIQFQNNQPEAGIKLLEQGIAAKPGDTRLMIVLAGVLGSRGENEKAAGILNRLIGMEPKVLSHRLMLASLYISMQDLDKAESVLRDATQASPQDNQARLALIQFLAEKRSQDVAITELGGMINKEPDNHVLLFALAALHDAKSEPDKAIDIYQGIITRDELKPDAITARNRLADLYSRLKRMDEAKLLLAEVLAQNANDPEALTLRGRIAMSENNALSAIADFRSVMRNQPDSVVLHRLLAAAHTANKEPDLALDLMQRAVTLAPADVRLRAEYIRYLAAGENTDEMLKQLDEILKLEPNNLEVLDAIYKIQVSKQDLNAASSIAEGMITSYPDKPIGYYYSGLVNRARKDPQASLQNFKKAVELAPETIEPLAQLVSLYMEKKETDTALAMLDEMLAKNSDNAVAHYVKGEILMSLKNSAGAMKSYEEAIRIKPDWHLPYRSLGNLYLARDKQDEAIKVYQRGIAATSSSLSLVTDLARLYEISGKYDESIRLYETALLKDNSSPVAANNLAMMLVDYRADEASLKRAAELVEPFKQSDNPAFLDTIGWLLYKQDKPQEAVPYLEKAVAAAPDSAGLHYHLGMAYVKTGNNTAAKEHLQKAMEGGQTFLGANEIEATLKSL